MSALKLLPAPNEDPPADYGPAMLALNVRQRAFVELLATRPELSQLGAARLAGYEGDDETLKVTGYRLSHDRKVLEGMKETASRMLSAGALIGMRAIIEIAQDANHKDRLKAGESLLARSGLGVINQSKLTIEHVGDDREKVAQIVALTKRLGFQDNQIKALLGDAGVVVDAEFEVVTADATAALEKEWTV